MSVMVAAKNLEEDMWIILPGGDYKVDEVWIEGGQVTLEVTYFDGVELGGQKFVGLRDWERVEVWNI